MSIQQQLSRMRHHAMESGGDAPVAVRISHFLGQSGMQEYHLMLQPIVYADLATQSRWLREAYHEACAMLGLGEDSAIFRRFFCSDLSNQASALTAHFGDMEATSAVSWVSQPPAPPAKVALWAYHAQVAAGEKMDTWKDGATFSLRRGELTHCWTACLTSTEDETSRAQTDCILATYGSLLRMRGLTLADHVLRTWFFVQNLDSNYQGLVTSRREYFAEHGLTAATHFIASTGIEGTSSQIAAKVMMDAYAISGVRPEQIRYISAPDHLCPTHHYGVTFERGTSVTYRDRKHIFISGTASIDNTGTILHPGDIRRQLDRTLENVAALLRQAGATLADVGMFLVYARDPSDIALLQQLMAERCGDAPIQVVQAAVCRPGWLVEIECMATVDDDNPGLPPF